MAVACSTAGNNDNIYQDNEAVTKHFKNCSFDEHCNHICDDKFNCCSKFCQVSVPKAKSYHVVPNRLISSPTQNTRETVILTTVVFMLIQSTSSTGSVKVLPSSAVCVK
ncbi:hypothetical protein OS493_025919 [Desmophyllum pertusum]|uniref:WAP domain-containing protein n=1 Tax=Desmophyllum pertusum TaxID=174260 RepID=A0A9W9YZ80_9CNID|nr:hypothetical protein OS493_025919 [Desmophyllum pertusum]